MIDRNVSTPTPTAWQKRPAVWLAALIGLLLVGGVALYVWPGYLGARLRGPVAATLYTPIVRHLLASENHCYDNGSTYCKSRYTTDGKKEFTVAFLFREKPRSLEPIGIYGCFDKKTEDYLITFESPRDCQNRKLPYLFYGYTAKTDAFENSAELLRCYKRSNNNTLVSTNRAECESTGHTDVIQSMGYATMAVSSLVSDKTALCDQLSINNKDLHSEVCGDTPADSPTNQLGDIDSFDPDGIVLTSFGSSTDTARAVVVQPDGKIVAGGYASSSQQSQFAVARYNSDGSLDTSFDGDGKVVTPTGSGAHNEIASIVLQPDGKIVASGSSKNGTGWSDFTVVRYNSNGSLDTSFDGDGIATTSIGENDTVGGMVLQLDGKIVVVGTTWERPNPNASSQTVASMVRYNTNGSLDTTFDQDGKITMALGGPSGADAVAIDRDGKLLVGGMISPNGDGDSRGFDIFLARYNRNGSLDTTFGNGTGTTVISFGNPENRTLYDGLGSIAIQNDGKIILGGSSRNPDNQTLDVGLIRLTAQGTFDPSFDGGGKVVTGFGDGEESTSSVLLQTDGKILIVGSMSTVPSSNNNIDKEFGVIRYNANGSLDQIFGSGGRMLLNVGGKDDSARAGVLQSDGRLIVVGTARAAQGSINRDFALVRFDLQSTPTPTPATPTPTPTSTPTPTPTPAPATPIPSPPPGGLSLSQVHINNCEVTVNYSKNFTACGHLLSENNTVLSLQNNLCQNSGPVTTTTSAFTSGLQPGTQVKLCNGNNYGECTNLLAVTGGGSCN